MFIIHIKLNKYENVQNTEVWMLQLLTFKSKRDTDDFMSIKHT